jgi:putative DNA primase/helicase
VKRVKGERQMKELNLNSAAIKLKYDGKVTIFTGRSRKDKKWKCSELLWSHLVGRLSETYRTYETQEEYRSCSKEMRAGVKDIGGFVGGILKEGRRKAENIAGRSLITFDMDSPKGDVWSSVEVILGCSCVMYSTHSHEPNNPRLRLVIPLTRQVSSEEYEAVARKLASDIGMDFFDDTNYEPHRLMYWPSTSKDGEYIFKYQDEPWLNPDEILSRYKDWRDIASWPRSSKVKQVVDRASKELADPYKKKGIIGAFCRSYSIKQAIETFLNEVYVPSSSPDRYSYAAGSSYGGLVVYEDKHAYSYHSTDRAAQRLLNSFDLVRIHKFGALDGEASEDKEMKKLPSYKAMLELAKEDAKVKLTLGEEKLKAAAEDFGEAAEPESDRSWLLKLKISEMGQFVNTISNVVLILQNDPKLKNAVAYNEFSNRMVLIKPLPWHQLEAEAANDWRDSDDSGLRYYIEKKYNIHCPSKIYDALAVVAMENKFHPIRDYLNSLTWDGENRLETLLIDYLGAEDTSYNRIVVSKVLTAAVARVFNPGIKFDYMLVAVGPQGLGKSQLPAKLGGKWYSDSLITVQGKEAFEALQGCWILEMAELAATKKAEMEAVKHYISKCEDAYRPAYGRSIVNFPRQCIFWGTTNDKEFLKDRTGNRRFWPVDVGITKPTKNLWTDFDESTRDMIWGEAVELWKSGEKLHLDIEEEKISLFQQKLHSEDMVKAGIIQEYLEKLLPANWNSFDLNRRRIYLHDEGFAAVEGILRRDRVCVMEIWSELFEGDAKQLTGLQCREIHDIMKNMEGWEPYSKGAGKLRFGKLYGKQKAYIRVDNLEHKEEEEVSNDL